MSAQDMPWRDPSRLTGVGKARLGHISDRAARGLDPSSDEHEYVWGFRTDRPHEEHRRELGWASDARADWHSKLAAAGHTMSWQLSGDEPGHCPEWQGTCGDCGANIGVSAASSSCWRLGKDAREGACSGPGTAWQDEMLRDRQHSRLDGAVSQFGQAVKDIADRQWLQQLGLDGEPEPDADWLQRHGIDPEAE